MLLPRPHKHHSSQPADAVFLNLLMLFCLARQPSDNVFPQAIDAIFLGALMQATVFCRIC